MRYQFEKGAFTKTWDIVERRDVQTFHLPHQFVSAWQRQMNTEFSALPAEEQKSDYEEADKILAIIAELQSLLDDYARRVMAQDTLIATLQQREEMNR